MSGNRESETQIRWHMKNIFIIPLTTSRRDGHGTCGKTAVQAQAAADEDAADHPGGGHDCGGRICVEKLAGSVQHRAAGAADEVPHCSRRRQDGNPGGDPGGGNLVCHPDGGILHGGSCKTKGGCVYTAGCAWYGDPGRGEVAGVHCLLSHGDGGISGTHAAGAESKGGHLFVRLEMPRAAIAYDGEGQPAGCGGGGIHAAVVRSSSPAGYRHRAGCCSAYRPGGEKCGTQPG